MGIRNVAASVILGSALGLGSLALAQDTAPVAPDNTAVNVRDRATDAVTPEEQSSAPGDIELTRKIRRAIVEDDSLSMMAHNVKIVSSGGRVVLRGPVETREKRTIGRKARGIAGKGMVDNQLEVKGG